ncbi:MAG: capsule biosynthesis protein [Campylobacterales bacterium]|nr:capsule biosynthesis protein [Campylobacterales bacterium]
MALTLNWIKKYRLFSATVVAPTLIASIYYGMIASDIYISESQFVVRAPDKPTVSGLGAMLQSTGLSSAHDDVYTVRDYILSRDALTSLDQNLSYHKLYGDSKSDIFSRFNGFGLDDSFEALYKYYQKYIGISIDSQSSILTLSVQAFDANEAKKINEYLLSISEQLVNRLNERGRTDMIGFAEDEVARAMVRAKTASMAVSTYRDAKSVFDPEKQSALQLQLVSKIQDELIATRAQLSQMISLSPENPQVELLQNKIANLTSQIASETAKVTGSNSSLAQKSSKYEQLILERDFAGKQLAAALASLESARNEALRQHLYLERISQANTPDIALEPRRIRSILTVFILGLIVWGILSMLLAGIREHND